MKLSKQPYLYLSLIAYLVTLAYAVFTPKGELGSGWFSLLGDSKLLEPLTNLLLLMPLMFFITILSPLSNKKKRISFVFLTSAFIETIQQFIPGRVPEIRDLILNTLGGYLVLVLLHDKSRNKR